MLKKSCQICGTIEDYDRYHHGTRKQFEARKFCSAACFGQSVKNKKRNLIPLSKKCEHCGNSFSIDDVAGHSYAWFSKARFCSRACATLGRILDFGAEFEHRYVPEPNSGCWIWTGSLTTRYGSFSVNGKNERAHVLSYKKHNGDIPVGMVVRHTCDTPLCVNPDHLILGTQSDNMKDMADRGRSARGSRSPGSKLTEDDVRYILTSKETGSSLSRRFKISPSIISQIRSRQIWRHVDV